jgi:hypothetical protein
MILPGKMKSGSSSELLWIERLNSSKAKMNRKKQKRTFLHVQGALTGTPVMESA